MTTKRFAMETAGGKGVMRYEAFLEKGVFKNLTNITNKAKPVRYSYAYGKRIYDAKIRGVTSREEAVGKARKVKAGRPKGAKKQREVGATSRRTTKEYNKVLRSIGIARGEYDNGKWNFGAFKKAQSVYRVFRDELSRDAWDNPKARIRVLDKCYSHATRPIYACIIIDDAVSPSMDEEESENVVPADKKYYIKYDNIYYADVCQLKYNLVELEAIIMDSLTVTNLLNQDVGIEFKGVCGYNVRLD